MNQVVPNLSVRRRCAAVAMSLLVALAASVPALAQSSDQAAIEAIAEFNRRYLAAINNGDLAYQRGTFVVIARLKDGSDVARTEGNLMRIYRRLPDGRWFMVRDKFDSD